MIILQRVSEIVVAAIFAVIAGVNIIETILYGQYHALIIALPCQGGEHERRDGHQVESPHS